MTSNQGAPRADSLANVSANDGVRAASSLPQRLGAEFLGSLLLAGVVIGSGILGERLAGGNAAIALLANTAATAAILFVIVTAFAPISGAHFNPAVTLVMVLTRATKPGDGALYIAAQIAGCIAGVLLAHAMFELPLLQEGTHERSGLAQGLSEAVAAFALVLTILLVSRARADALAAAVALVIAAGYWWTASTSFANPAITLARAMSDTFAGIRMADAPLFIGAQIVGALLALSMATLIAPSIQPRVARDC
jgi:glycerol uptake facilitator-like aquaporin